MHRFIYASRAFARAVACGGNIDDPGGDNPGGGNGGGSTKHGKVGNPIDLGLSVKWASWNIGAEKPEEYGDYFAWGETEMKESYTWENYKWKDESKGITKYTGLDGDSKTVLEAQDDAAHVIWKGDWRMPTKDEMKELEDNNNCEWIWETVNGITGFTVKSKKNGNSIFIPASGAYYSYASSTGEYGHYWSSSYHSDTMKTNEYASYMMFTDGHDPESLSYLSDYNKRYVGYTIRPVKK